ncbi:MAG: glycosyltransferase family 4 protein [Rhodospirillales bacterium]|nr:glycosyltransferase family 4 protein [Rhodospirillales bacterium]
MKILVNALSARSGGIATYTKNLAHSFLSRKLDSIFAVSNDFELEEGVPTIRFSANRMPPIKRFFWEQLVWRRVVKKYKPDILFSSANFGLLFSPVSQILLMREGGLFDPFYLSNIGPSLSMSKLAQRIARRKLILASARASKIIMTPSNAAKALLIAADKSLESRVIINKNGTNTKLFSHPVKKKTWKKDGRLNLLYVSVYYPHKIPGIISEAVAQLNAKGIKTHLSITMNLDQIQNTAGGEKDFILLKKGIERNQVTLLGTVSYTDLPSIYAQHDLFVFPSISETFGHPLVEAMSMGLPVIASDTSIHREVCKDSAVYYSPFSISDLTQKIMELHLNKTKYAILSENGIKNSRKNFLWEKHVDRLISIMENSRN